MTRRLLSTPWLYQNKDLFVGVYWQSYGWVASGETISGLEDGYRLSVGMPRLLL